MQGAGPQPFNQQERGEFTQILFVRHREHGLELVGEEVEEVPGLRGELLEAREHAVGAVEAVAELEDADGDERSRVRGQGDEDRRGGDEDEEIEERDLEELEAREPKKNKNKKKG